MQEISTLFTANPVYQQLLAKIKAGLTRNGLVPEVIEVGGVPFSLHEILVKALEHDFQAAILYCSRDSVEVRRYLSTLQTVSLKDMPREQLLTLLANHNFERLPKVHQKGEFSITGDVISFWPVGFPHPLRVSYFGDQYEEARLYDEIYGRSYHELHQVLIGDCRQLESAATRDAIVSSAHEGKVLNVGLIFGGDTLDNYASDLDIQFDFSYPGLYFQRFDLLAKEIDHLSRQGFEIIMATKHTDALPPELRQYVRDIPITLEAGISSTSMKVLYLTDRELFGTVFLSKATKRLTSTQARKMLSQLEGEIEIGDYVVHEDHGIGIYKGIKQEAYKQDIWMGVGEYKTKVIYEDYLLIAYAEGDELYVPLSQIDKITKYINDDEAEPRITRLGKQEWSRITKRVKESVAKFAKDLVEHYAKRALAKAPAIETDESQAFADFLESFPYKPTPDQITTEKEIYHDLQSSQPMNRLIVGDVGFGKTEVAMRAAFKVAETGLQVAVLCPTTVLAAQHEQVFKERFAGSPFKIASLSRFTSKDNKSTIARIAKGEVNIIIGTHRLLSSDIEYKKLGLLIIDEEQKFGVKQKEKIKQLEYGVHVLTMSATPIPRTLSMALSAIQDISIIQTPPEGRKAVTTIVQKMDWQRIVGAIMAEVQRHGQVYYLHNRVQTIQSVFTRLQRLLPGVRFAMAHGQMDSNQLQQTVSAFYNDEYDVLVCTTIIENGIDMQNVNTIIIEQAQNFGLGQLYQLRGRVGRGLRQAFAYLFYEGENIDKEEEVQEVDTPDGKKKVKKKRDLKYKQRLKALLDLQELGSGFRLASRDLEIRGAGNLLGREQHGNISYIGYGLYMQLLAEEIERLKNIATEHALRN